MINPSEVGKSGELVRLRTLESIWVQGKLRMWGRWSYIGGGSGGNMFNQLLASGKITKSAINDALRRMKKSGITKPELEAYLREILDSKNKTGLAFCSDEEGLKIDGVIAAILMNEEYHGLYSVIVDRHRLRKSKLQMAKELNSKHPGWTLITCRRRIDTWVSLAESILYAPLCDAFATNSDRFTLQSEQESA
ncbi:MULTISPECIES: DUF1133 family protein [Enterobacter cloacae complex]|jgi:hypothetical protein|uniref:DUF1133 family protein n=1 Tax=Enterobacter cloacae complex TaxID=354276 RepID=UPI0006521724|nr:MULTISPECIES: DUF1133 family protein [Enterobacter cloacae complex]HAS0796030.1 DUF1133 family protein [Enterobacter hormaechei subsp. xiangfangensis]KLW40187.1 hypothetical protein SK53_01352 [Enterobacter sp. MGH119]MBW7784271.1 DUF1133 family protein [Enterobacter hormaechei]MCM7338961.1 DUF1133 family protein [Enterobacter hormaechei]MCM7361760.1 DUF1133 family protein [Enterobacter hormaechei]